jgi:hypothetical protein
MAMQLREKPKLSTCARLTAFPEAQYYNCMPENKYRGEVLIELDRPRKFRLDFNAIVEAEDILGEQFDLTKITDSARKIRAVLYAGLKRDDSELTLDKAGELVGLHNQSKVIKLLIAAATGKTLEEVDAEPKNAESPEGKVNGKVGRSKTVSAGQPASA